jgi:hypothetical protein
VFFELAPVRDVKLWRFDVLASGCRRLRLRPDGGQQQPYRDSRGYFEESTDADHPCRLGTRYEHNDG